MALKNIKVVEMMGLAPGPLCGTILADFGAKVTVVQKIEPSPVDVLSNGKRMLSLNLKKKEGVNILRKLCAVSDVLLDTYRPGVMENLGLGPDILLKDNPCLIYARLTGFGQNGVYANKAGHDINYIAMSGFLSALSKNDEPPYPPINFAADFAGGSVLCSFGIVLALFERMLSNKGQVIDASMTEGTSYIATWLYKSRKLPLWAGKPGTNFLDGGYPFYATYKTKDGKFMAVGALEPQFYLKFIQGLGLSVNEYSQLSDIDICKKKFTEVFLSRTQDEWCEIFKDLDACVTPVLNMQDVDLHNCHQSRQSFYRDSENTVVPNPAPRLSRTPGKSVGLQPQPKAGQHTKQILMELKYEPKEIQKLIEEGTVYVSNISHL